MRLRWRRAPRRETNWTLSFEACIASKAMLVCCWEKSTGAALIGSHPLQLLLRVAHGLESLLDPFRERASELPEETITTALGACDAIRTLLGSLTRNGAGGPVSPELLASGSPNPPPSVVVRLPMGAKPRFVTQRLSASS